MDSERRRDLVTQWDVTRRTAEFFDKSINDNRKIFLTLTIALATASAALVDKVETSSPNTVLMAFTTGIVGLSMIFWGLEFHNGEYLRLSAAAARNLEKELNNGNKKLGVSTELFWYRDNRNVSLKSKDWLVQNFTADSFVYLVYPSVALTAISIASIINYNGHVFFNLEYVVWTVSLVILVEICFYLLFINYNLFRHYCKERYTEQKESNEQRQMRIIENAEHHRKLKTVSFFITDLLLLAYLGFPSWRIIFAFLSIISIISTKILLGQYLKNLMAMKYLGIDYEDEIKKRHNKDAGK